MKTEVPPEHLSDESKLWWTLLTTEYIFQPSQLLVLQTAFESFDRMRQAQAELAANGGVTTRDRWGQRKPHPATVVERDSRAGFLSALKFLGVDITTEV